MDGKSYDCFSQNKWTLGAQFYGTNNIRGAEKQSINKTKRSQFVVQASEQFYDELNNAGGRNMVQLKGQIAAQAGKPLFSHIDCIFNAIISACSFDSN